MSLELAAIQDDLLAGPPSSGWLRGWPLAQPISSWSPPDFWGHLVGAKLRLVRHFTTDDRAFLVARAASTEEQSAALSSREIDVLCRLLIGQSQKWMSYELGVSASTVATHVGHAFAKLGLPTPANAIPLALVLIGQGSYGAIHLSDRRVTTSMLGGQRSVIFSVARPPATRLSNLTCAEREIALALVNGLSKFDVARARSTSVNTIGRQVGSLFGKLKVKGRFDLIRRMSQ